jgi:acetyl esterase/lipase
VSATRWSGGAAPSYATVAMSLGAELQKRTHVYRCVDGVDVELDLYAPAASGDRLPVVVWIHGGALIMGSRSSVAPHLLAFCRDRGFALASIDYRLAPQVKAPAIVEDVVDAFRWIRERGAAVARLDPGKIVVVGASAGGYLTLMTGIMVEPTPVALVSYYGYGDVDEDWYTRPSEHYRTVVPLYAREEALGGLRGGVVTSPPDEAQAVARRRYYHYLRQNGLWTREVTGYDPASEGARLDPYCPVRNVTAEYPPTMLIHGMADTDVPYDRSVNMAHALERQGVEHELVTVPGAEHGLVGVDQTLIDGAHEKALAFLARHLG